MSIASSLAITAGQALAPLRLALLSPDDFVVFLEDLGWSVDDLGEDVFALAALQTIADGCEEIVQTVASFEAGTVDAGTLVGTVIPTAQTVVTAVHDLANMAAADVAQLAAPLNDPATWIDLAQAVPDLLFSRYLQTYQPVPHAILRVFGVITSELYDRGPPREVVHWDRLGEFLSDPAGRFATEYRWVAGPFEYGRLLVELNGLATALGLNARLAPPDTVTTAPYYGAERPLGLRQLQMPIVGGTSTASAVESHYQLAAALTPVPAAPGAEPSGLLLAAAVQSALSLDEQLTDDWRLTVTASAQAAGGLGLVVLPDEVRPAAVSAAAEATLGFEGEPVLPWPLAGGRTGTRIELSRMGLALSVVDSAPSSDVALELDLSNAVALVIDPRDAGAFLEAALGGGDIVIRAGAALRWSARDGLTVSGAAGFEIVIPLDATAGPLTVDAMRLAVYVGTSGADAELTASGSLVLGPLAVSVRDLGVRGSLKGDEGAPAGAVDIGGMALSAGLREPSGFGISLNVEVVTGGGYLELDPENGSYFGILELGILGVGINAVGIIETDLPDVDGWSMFFALFIEVPAIPLGFGFNLTGVGGLCGINRTMDVEALQAGVRSGALDAVLFPEDPIAQAPFVIDQLQSMFPPAAASYVFGPVVQISWGPSSLIEAEVGIVIALPDPITIAVLGSISSVLPTPNVDLVALNLDVLGIIDFASGELSVDGSLHHSHVIGFALSGDMALRAGFADEPSFLMSLGGFHPGFSAPAGFPTLRRLSLAINADPIISIHFECYMALTSNTVQFGAALHLSATIAGFGIEGGTEFDALIQFSPFELTTRLAFEISIKAATIDLAGVWLEATVVGPNPWYLLGTARFKILGIEEELRVDERIGQARPDPELPAEELFPVLLTALGEAESWSVVAAPASGVVLAPEVEVAVGELLVSPDGAVAVSQRAVPLSISIDKVGNAPLADYDVFNLEAGDGLEVSAKLDDWFAPGHFFDIPPREKLSTPSFERLGSGLEFGGGPVVAGPARQGTLSYEEILRDPELDVEMSDRQWVPRNDPRSDVITEISSVARATPIAVGGQAEVGMADVPFAVVEVASGNVRAVATSWSSARHTIVGRAPGHVVVPQWETRV